MSVLVDRGEQSALWEGGHYLPAPDHVTELKQLQQTEPMLTVALVNNMPDAAVEDTEAQFLGLLTEAANGRPLHVRLYSLPKVPRSERTREYLAHNYATLDELLNRRFDGVIVTGTEPKQADLRQEPYWEELCALFDWAEQNTSSAVLSCLAAHAGALYSDGILRNPLKDKRFGVFEQQVLDSHPLIQKVSNPTRNPHSRWNELKEADLQECGYSVLTKSPEAGVDLFVKQKHKSLFVHFQGHPEYGGLTLLKEYRRDIRRYLRHERETYPSGPRGYFDESAIRLLEDFEQAAKRQQSEEIMERFPEARLAGSLENTWRASAVRIYRNWLDCLLARHGAEAGPFVMARASRI
jgi:homoserine O-succinyltransferase/O-acetyltransferase